MERFKLKFVTLFLLTPFLSACFQLQEIIEIRDDASARLILELGINSTLYAFTKLGEDEDALCEPHNRGPEDYPADSNIASSTVELKARDDNVFCIATYEIRDIRNFDAAELEDDGGFGNSPGMGQDLTLRISDDGNGVLALSQSFSSDLADPDRAQLGDDAELGDEFGEAFLSTMFAGKNITISLRAPKIIETNGDISEDGKEATWQLPVAELVDENSKFDKEFRAQVKYELSWWDWAEGLLPQ